MESASQTRTAASLRALLDGLIDYAGLFPPAALDMRTAVENYAKYLAGEHRWALGRFIVPVARLEEFREQQTSLITPSAESIVGHSILYGPTQGIALGFDKASRGKAEHFPWKLSAIVGENAERDLESISHFNSKNAGKSVIDAVEIKVLTIDHVRRIAPLIPKELTAYLEIPVDSRDELFYMLRATGVRAKIRTGGLVETAFPAAEQVAHFIVRCADAKVAFKATAGLHHPLRCMKPLTYASDAPKGTMHGFLNVFLAACIYGGLGEQVDRSYREQVKTALLAILLNETPANFVFEDDKATLRGMLTATSHGVVRNSNYELTVSTEVIRHARHSFAVAFGSCSFEEPIEDLRSFHLL